jgi:hypothetical protein
MGMGKQTEQGPAPYIRRKVSRSLMGELKNHKVSQSINEYLEVSKSHKVSHKVSRS